VVLEDALGESWEGDSFGAGEQGSSVVLNKQNIVAIIPARDSPTPQSSPTEQIQKVPLRLTLYAAPLLVHGNLNFARGVDWQRGLSILREEFLILTNAIVDQFKTRTPMEADLPLMLVNRSRIVMFQVENQAAEE
jgi:hypothetical protein